MCKIQFYQHPICNCISISGTVRLCPLFTTLPENKNKTSFRRKILTPHCQHLDLLFNGVDYVSVDIEGHNGDVVPKGLYCPDIDQCNEGEEIRPCGLCDSEGALKYLRVRGIQYTFDKAARMGKMQGEAAQEQGEFMESSGGESAEKSGSSSSGRENKAAGKTARSGSSKCLIDGLGLTGVEMWDFKKLR